jgi:glutamate formiminotransferase / formiminotetrahydrofolate cyclodeaminase
MEMRLIECVPNFSEGRDDKVIAAITDAIMSVSGVKLLDVDPGASTNRTVVTFVGEPEAALEAAFQGIKMAQQLIDMRKHSGVHPRMGATDVCPFVPVSGATMEECTTLAERLGQRVGEELKIPVYLYANSARRSDRQSLADIRKGEYEALPQKMEDPNFKPDFGPAVFNAQSGATVIGARPFLIAYNVNLNTKSKKLANEIALNIREAGRAEKGPDGAIVKDKDGISIKKPGLLKACRAVGWYVDEYERAQISINLIDSSVTSMHHAFDACCKQAEALGLRVTGSEIVGLVPLSAMLDAGRHYLARQGRSTGVSEQELVTTAIQSLGLADLAPFDPQNKIIEYKVRTAEKLLIKKTVADFLDELASESPAPGGGSVSALCGALSASLTAMVANLSYEKKGLEKHRPKMQETAVRAQELKQKLARAVDNDMQAFNKIIDARRLPKTTPEEIETRANALFAANKEAVNVPLQVLQDCSALIDLAAVVVKDGNQNSLSDAGCAVLNAVAAGEGAFMNVLINLAGFAKDGEEGLFREQSGRTAALAISSVRQTSSSLKATVLGRLEDDLVLSTVS